MVKLQPGRSQPLDQVPVARLAEKLVDTFRNLWTHLLGLLQRLDISFGDRVQAAESFRQQHRCPHADKADPQPDQKSRQRILPRFFDVAQNVLRGFLPHPLQIDKLLERQVVNIRDASHQPAIDKLIDQRIPHTVDVHHRAGGEVPDRLLEPGGTVGVDAARSCFVFFTNDVPSAYRTVLRHVEGLPPFALLYDPHDFRNHVAATLHQHFVADFRLLVSDRRSLDQGSLVRKHQIGPRQRWPSPSTTCASATFGACAITFAQNALPAPLRSTTATSHRPG